MAGTFPVAIHRSRLGLVATAFAVSSASLLGCPAPFPAFRANLDGAADASAGDSIDDAAIDAIDTFALTDAIDAANPDSEDTSTEIATGHDASDALLEVIVPDGNPGCDSGGGCDPMCVDTTSCGSCGGCGNVCNTGEFCFNGLCRTDADCQAECGGRSCGECAAATPCP